MSKKLPFNADIAFEVAGPSAMFTRPDTGSTPISYPVPTYSAARGMFDAVLRRPHIIIKPLGVEICKPVRYERFITNYGGPLRKADQIKRNNNYQLVATILVDVCYRIYGRVISKKSSSRGKNQPQVRRRRGKDWCPQFKRLFEERLKQGHTFYTPCLGWKEFVPTYFGPLRKGTHPDSTVDDIVIPSFLRSMWKHRELKPKFVQDWQIVKGVMSYVTATPVEEATDVE